MPDDERWLAGLGRCVLVVAPHPDDESIGCGGLMARLRQLGVTVAVLLVSDGTMSHPGSRQFPAAARQALRESEVRAALACLGVDVTALYRLACPDGAVPGPGEPGFAPAVDRLKQLLERLRPETVFAPWRRDPHRDHRASTAIVRRARARCAYRPRLLEYPVWLDERGSVADRPAPGEVHEHRLDVSSVREQKARAVAAHASQHGTVIADDPDGFVLAPDLVKRALDSPERFFETVEAWKPGRLQSDA